MDEALLAQLAAKDVELEKLKEELMRLKAAQASQSSSTAAGEAAQPEVGASQPQPPQQTSSPPPARQKKILLSHIPYECISTKSPDGKEHWPSVSRVTPPQPFADNFSDMVKVGCYCWRIVDKIVFSSRADKKQERVLAITAEFLFICDLSANINRVLRCRDIERVLIQETPTGTMLAVKAFSQCEEHSIMLELRPDPRNPTNKVLQPLFALNYTRKPRTKTDLELIKVAPTTDLRRHPAAGSFARPQGYLAPHLKIQKWRETGKWPCGSTSILPTARSVPGAHKLRTMEATGKAVTFKTGEGEQVTLEYAAGKVAMLVDGSVMDSAVADITLEGRVLKSANGAYEIFEPEAGPKSDALLRELAIMAAKAKIPTKGLPTPLRRQKGRMERKASLDMHPVGSNPALPVSPVARGPVASPPSMQPAPQPGSLSPPIAPAPANAVAPAQVLSPASFPSPSPEIPKAVTDIRFIDTDGDVSILRLNEGRLEWWANDNLEIEACTYIKFHDEVLTSGPVSAKVAEPAGDQRKEMLWNLALMASQAECMAAGLPLVPGAILMDKHAIQQGNRQCHSVNHNTQGQMIGGGSDASSAGSQPTYSHNPYATDDDDRMSNSDASSFCSTSSMPHFLQQDVHSNCSNASNQEYFAYPYMQNSHAGSETTDACSTQSRPTLLSSTSLAEAHRFNQSIDEMSDCSAVTSNASTTSRCSSGKISPVPNELNILPPPILTQAGFDQQPQLSLHTLQPQSQSQSQSQPQPPQTVHQPVQPTTIQPAVQPTVVMTSIAPSTMTAISPAAIHPRLVQVQSQALLPQDDNTGVCMRLAVLFKHGRRGEYASKLKVQQGAHVLVEHPDGMDVALVVGTRQGGRLSDRWKVRRVASPLDVQKWQALVVEEEEALQFARQFVAQVKLPIVLHRAEYQIDKKKLTFHFSSDQAHPDFASLVHHAHSRFGCRIWMNNCQPKPGERGELIDLQSDPCPTF